jgi:glycosyltransferase involved in cell wall biosynthesis
MPEAVQLPGDAVRDPAVSVVVPAHDTELYLAEAIESILGQTIPPAEVIIVDDGSQDGTAEVAEGFGTAVTVLRQERGGVGAAVNSGLEIADGDLVAFLDADDVWTPRKLERQRAVLGAEPETDMVFGRVEQFISPDLTPEERAELRPPVGSLPGKVKGTMLIRRPAFERVGPFDTSWKIADFVDWYTRAHGLGLRERMLGEVLLRRRLHRTNSGRINRLARDEYAKVVAIARRRRRSGTDPSGAPPA